jgi:hypothetical protein
MTNAVALAQGASNNVTFRNRLINGNMVLDQRNAGASVSGTTGVYTLDRWKVQNNSGAARFNVQQNAGSVTPPSGYKYYLGITSTSAYSVASSDIIGIQQFVEGYNISDLAWGTSSALAVTLSFWVRSSLTGTFGGSVVEGSAGGALYPFSYTISAANTWEQKSVTIAGPTIGTWNSTNGAGIQLLFSMGTGSTFTGTAGSWTTSSYYAPTGATSVVGTNGATFYITGVQLEAGTTASPFEYRQYGTELELCMRYYKKIGGTYAGQNGTGYVFIGSGLQRSTTSAAFGMAFSPTMRATPSVSFDSNVVCSDRTNFDTTLASLSSIAGDGNGMEFFAAFSACGAQFRPMLLSTASVTTGYMDFSSEL